MLRGQSSGPDVRRLLVCVELGLQLRFKYPYILSVFGYCTVVSLTAFSVICNKNFYKVYTLLSHTPHHTKSPLGSRGRDIVSVCGDNI